MSHSFSNRLLSNHTYPEGFTDHHLVTFDFHVSQTAKPSSHWHCNVKLLQDNVFCRRFEMVWEIWRWRKGDFRCVSQWWEVWKAHIRLFCQQYISHSMNNRTLKQKKKELSIFVQTGERGFGEGNWCNSLVLNESCQFRMQVKYFH